jgi:hypothetical protein
LTSRSHLLVQSFAQTPVARSGGQAVKSGTPGFNFAKILLKSASRYIIQPKVEYGGDRKLQYETKFHISYDARSIVRHDRGGTVSEPGIWFQHVGWLCA